MATCDALSNVEDLTSCSICFEKFKSPRLLPCSHSFCHKCLCAHIVSSCEHKDVPLGFPCPLCREFIPSPGQLGETTQWVDKFPINDVMVQMVNETQDFKICWACRRGNEEEESNEFCLTCGEPLCKLCSKFHRINLTSMNHKLCPILELGSHSFCSSRNILCCEKHKKQIVLFCNDHRAPCCSECFTMDHKKCAIILTVEKAVKNLRSLKLMEELELQLENMKEGLQKAKRSQEDNMRLLDDDFDKYTKDAEKLQQDILSHVNKLFDKHFIDIAKKTKEAKQTLEKNTLSVSDRLNFVEHLLKQLKQGNEPADIDERNIKYILTFHTVKEKMAEILKNAFNESNVVVTLDIYDSIKQILDFTSIGTMLLTEIPIFEIIDARKAEFSKLIKYHDLRARVRGCTVLPNGNLLCTDHENSCCVLIKEKNQETIQHSTAFQLESLPWDILLDEGVLYVSYRSHVISHVHRFSADDFHSLDPIHAGTYCSGLAIIGDLLFVVSESCCILKLNKNGQGQVERIYQTQTKHLRYLIDLADGTLVLSNFYDDLVKALDEMGMEKWTYQHTELKGPYGLDKDSQSNIYVAGRNSNNIHILSRQGFLLRILGDIISPVCLKLRKGTCTAFVVCHEESKVMSQLMLYQFK